MTIEEIGRRRLASISEVANRVGWSRNTVWRKVKDGLIPATQLGRKWFISLEYVAEIERDAYKGNLKSIGQEVNTK